MIKKILCDICAGNDVIFNEQLICDNNRKDFYNVLIGLYSRSSLQKKEKQAQGIKLAKMNGRYKGRKPIQVDKLKFIDLLFDVKKGKKKPKEVTDIFDKYYRFKKKLEKENNSLLQEK